MQCYPWAHRSDILDKTDDEVKVLFRDWRTRPECPWYVKDQYLKENNRRARAGAGPAGKRFTEEDYDRRIADLLKHNDYAGAATVQYQQELATSSTDSKTIAVVEGAAGSDDQSSVKTEQEHFDGESSHGEQPYRKDDKETRVLKMLYRGNMAEVS